ncbi:MAG: hypothetical protein QXW79_00520 [Thermoplasmata archaeon]
MKVNLFYIILGLALGIFVIYTTTPPPKIIIKYPTIDNIHSTTYIDDRGQCYKYYAEEVPCPKSKI